mmetsp:Transcript_22646/g.65903  ORF Transcript_22646/g.65903 Transcript_22646/m.65903 type:complete len:228 (-) Transcript_22646:44-727(-)
MPLHAVTRPPEVKIRHAVVDGRRTRPSLRGICVELCAIVDAARDPKARQSPLVALAARVHSGADDIPRAVADTVPHRCASPNPCPPGCSCRSGEIPSVGGVGGHPHIVSRAEPAIKGRVAIVPFAVSKVPSVLRAVPPSESPHDVQTRRVPATSVLHHHCMPRTRGKDCRGTQGHFLPPCEMQLQSRVRCRHVGTGDVRRPHLIVHGRSPNNIEPLLEDHCAVPAPW